MRGEVRRTSALKPGRIGRPLAFGLAAAAIWAGPAWAEDMPLEEQVEQCAQCHGADGNSEMEGIPSLAGQPELFLLDQLVYMREGVRQVEAMAPFVEGLTDARLKALAEHFSGLEPEASDEPVDPALVERGAELAERKGCHSCHGRDFAGHDQIPRLAEQRIDYLFYALKAYRDDERRSADTVMSTSVAGLSDAELRALAHYAASR